MNSWMVLMSLSSEDGGMESDSSLVNAMPTATCIERELVTKSIASIFNIIIV